MGINAGYPQRDYAISSDALHDTLALAGYDVMVAEHGHAAMARMNEQSFGMVISDVQMRPMDGMELLQNIRSVHQELPVVIMTAYGTIEKAVDAMRAGASDHLVKPCDAESLLSVVKRLLPETTAQNPTQHELVAVDEKMQARKNLAARVAQSDVLPAAGDEWILASSKCVAHRRLIVEHHLGPQPLDCDGEVVSSHDRVRSEWVGHGIRFHLTGPETVDRLADALYNMAVPEILTRLTRPSRGVRQVRAIGSRLRGSTQFRAPRYEAFLPMRVQTRDGEEWLATTRDLSQSGLSLVSSRPVGQGRLVRLILRSPDGEWSSLATVVRATPMPGPDESLRTWLVGMRIDGHADVVGLRHILSAEALA